MMRCNLSAGIIPFAVREQKVVFLFQRPFGGRKRGYLVDFGGAGEPGEDYRDTAIREFIEETETLYFEDDLQLARRTPERIKAQIAVLNDYFTKTLSAHPDWRCRRRPGNRTPPKDWISFFIQLPYRDIEPLNKAWLNDPAGRFKKPRELHWVAGEELLRLYQEEPERLWKRVRQLRDVTSVIQSILTATV